MTPRSRALAQAFFADRTFLRSADVADPGAAQDALEAGGASAAVIIPRGFALRASRADSPEVQVLVDGTDATRAQVAASGASQFLLTQGIGTESPGGRSGAHRAWG